LLLDKSYITDYQQPVVTTSPSYTVSEILAIISKNLKRSHVCDHAHLRDYLSIQQSTKFEVSSLRCSKDILGELKI